MPLIMQAVLAAIFFIWLIFLTYLLFRLSAQYAGLTKGTSKKTVMGILESFADELQIAKKDLANLGLQYDKIEKDSQFHIQRIGLLRFNPFNDTGGDQSFILSLIDAKETGVVISGLYSRSGTRWYAKKVINGKGVEHDLSEDEKRSIQLAKSYKKEISDEK